jgi:protein-disulfide isomerase
LTGKGPDYVEIADLPPFRRLAIQGQTSGIGAALVGLDLPADDPDGRRARADALRADPCSALFGNEKHVGVVPIAYFSEFRCPYCRALEQDLDKLLADDPGSFRIVQHELPIFGPPSELAARASIAAARQGMQQDLRRRFMRTPVVAEEASVLRVAAGLGLDTDRLTRDMAPPEVQAELDSTRALADVFHFIGTPGLVIGHTVLNGSIPYAVLRQIAEDEKSAPEPVC